ncbi:MAG: helix-turn-helix transcriptional regulator [Ruminococcaceae bacterium]|nr:helix-turn-helix transcriptional regulator [Oscillospiraceae bacterium]
MNIYLGENLKNLRRKRNLTQEKLAEFLGVSFQAVSKWERGDTYPDISMLPEIADFFKISVDELLGVNRAENEKEITEKLQEYDNLTDSKLMLGIIN